MTTGLSAKENGYRREHQEKGDVMTLQTFLILLVVGEAFAIVFLVMWIRKQKGRTPSRSGSTGRYETREKHDADKEEHDHT